MQSAFPHRRFGRSLPLVVAGLAFLLAACASSSKQKTSETPDVAAIDAVIPSGDGWRVFRLAAQVHARVSPGDVGLPFWLRLSVPAGSFRPVQAVWAQRGYFHLVDAASSRMCLYDTSAALISTFPLPEEFTPFRAGRTAVFRGADGAFTFLDYASGEAWQFADRQVADAGAAQWIPRGRVKLPAGVRECVQIPGSPEILCRGGDGSPLRFDGALNKMPTQVSIASPASASKAGMEGGGLLRAAWDPGAEAWVLRALLRDGRERFRFVPAQRRWELPDRAPAPAP